MKKILGGYLFRAIKTLEIWLFIAVTIFAVIVSNLEYYGGVSSGNSDLLKSDYSLTTTAEDEYAFMGAYPQGGDAQIAIRIRVVLGKIDGAGLFAAASATIFTVLFLKSLFSQGTLRNLIASGHKKSTIYLASLIFCILVYILFALIALSTLYVFFAIRQWKFPLFMPLLTARWFMIFFIGLTLVSVALSVLFCTKKAIASLVTLVLIVVLASGTTSFGAISALMLPERSLSADKIKEYVDSHPDSDFETKIEFDIKNFKDKLSVLENGEPIDPEIYLGKKDPHYVDGTPRKILMAMIYANPGSYYLMDVVEVMTKYKMWEAGLYTMSDICCTTWSVIFTALGLAVFSKKELT